MTIAFGERTREARRLALESPHLTKAEIARAVGMTRQAVGLALRHLSVTLPDGRATGLRAGVRRTSAIDEARRKMQSGEPISREERHLLQQDYRRREREIAR